MKIDIALLPTQERFFCCEAAFPAFIGGYGAGKTFVGSVKAVVLAVQNSGLPGLIVAPTYRSLRDTNIPQILELLDAWGIRYKLNRTNYDITLAGYGSLLMCRSGDEPDSLKGPNVAWAGIDEVARVDESLWGVLVSRVRHPKATKRQCFTTGTPEGLNWVYERWVERANDDYVLFTASTSENIYLPRDYADHLRGSLDDDELQQKLHGHFVAAGRGRAYRRFNRALHVKDQSPFGEVPHLGLKICLCCDFNVDPCCWVLLQYKNDVIYAYDEIVQPDTDTAQMAEEARRRIGERNVIVYGDSAGAARSTAGRSDYVILQQYGFRQQDVPPGNPPVKDRISAVNVKLRNEQLFIHPRCTTLIRDLERVRWKEGANGVLDKSDGTLTHASDALGYFAHRLYGPRRRPPRPKRVSQLVR